MAPHADNETDDDRLPGPERPPMSTNPPRLLIIGAGSRGFAYAKATQDSSNGIVVAVVEPIEYKRKRMGELHIWGKSGPPEGQEFAHWKDYVKYELERRDRAARGEPVPDGADGVFICVLDEQHKEVIIDLAPLGLHIMCEKPLATSFSDCVDIYRALLPDLPEKSTPSKIFSIGHVLRYSPHNMLLRKLLLEDRVIGDIMSINHTEPVGWWHFTHSYVRGNWRKEKTTAPSLLTKSCHDIDFLLWLLCSPPPQVSTPAHIPKSVTSTGALQYFTKVRKPTAAGSATNCLSCPIESSCKYSAKKIYIGPQFKGLQSGNTHWPIHIVVPEIEDCVAKGTGESTVLSKLAEDYDANTTPPQDIESRNWFGRCVWESDNDVCDEQVVTMTWENDPLPADAQDKELALRNRAAKTAVFHMVAHTTKICERYTHIYGSDGEIYADSSTITVEDFGSATTKVYKPHIAGGGHGGGDAGLARQFILAIDRVKNGNMAVAEAQKTFLGCSLEEVIRSHAMVFCAEEARKGKKVVDFPEWWAVEVEGKLR
ncbi:NAD binding Rossmann fold oxidoreductase-like protein [Xylogone sp. PMI_703]|nr:NAD binding Rossmann fold oxidoreductase-like protein [Xylogone sp. PMI_703]